MRFGPVLAALGLCLATAACQTDPSRGIMNKEDMLSGAGFKFVPANTPERQAAFQKLPPHQFTRQIKDGKVIYVYADPTICVCIYVGGQKAYGTYNANRLQKRIADDQAATAAMNQMQANDFYMANNWDWGMWGYGMGWPYSDPYFF
jgi:hypothetical protein